MTRAPWSSRLRRLFDAALGRPPGREAPAPRLLALPAPAPPAAALPVSPPAGPESLDDLAGELYLDLLARLHEGLAPRSYLEIGTYRGDSLALARCPTIAIDPGFAFRTPAPVMAKPLCALYQTTSDAFYASEDPKRIFGGPIDFAFIDGLHHCECLLRDFINTERHSHRGGVIAMHDCLPLELPMADRIRGLPAIRPERAKWWTGDVWRAARALRQFRPDLRLTVLDAARTGLVLVDRLDPASRVLEDRYEEILAAMMAMSLERIGIARYHAEMGVVSTAILDTVEKIRARYRP
jgi:hypothetical protein